LSYYKALSFDVDNRMCSPEKIHSKNSLNAIHRTTGQFRYSQGPHNEHSALDRKRNIMNVHLLYSFALNDYFTGRTSANRRKVQSV
ncbi:MAG: hypothetical protein JSW59_12795, partial [Phycisphaerales bacterium]